MAGSDRLGSESGAIDARDRAVIVDCRRLYRAGLAISKEREEVTISAIS